MASDLISVIIPVYNAEKYLARCVDSVIKQTYTNIEIILVDDGSTDDSGSICDAYVHKDSRIKVIHKTNGGAAQARNRAISIAKGEWISFVDSDDSVCDEFLNVMYANAVNYGAEISCCRLVKTESLDIDYIKLNVNVPKEVLLNGRQACALLHKQTEALITQTLVNRIYDSRIFKEISIPEGNMCEDEAIIYKILYSCNKIVASYKYLYAYYQTPNSVMRANFSKKHLIYLEILEERLRFYKEKDEEELCCLAVKSKCYALQDYYCKCKIAYPDEKELYNSMRKEFLTLYMKAMRSRYIPLKSKLCLLIMRLSPMGYQALRG